MQNSQSTTYVLTADIGGSHITAAVCHLEAKTIVPQSLVRHELSSKASAEIILGIWENACLSAAATVPQPISAMGLAMPGPFDYENGISLIKGLNKYEALYQMDIKTRLATLLKLEPALVKFRNDAEATIAGETLAGAGKGYQNVMGITLGTGFGSAQFKGGTSHDLNLGALPFKQSIVDDNLSTRWFLRRYGELTGLTAVGVKELTLLADGNETVRRIFKEFAVNMGEVLAPTIESLKPDVLVICGNIAKASHLFLPYLKKQFVSTNIKLAVLGENAALIGAAGLFDKTDTSLADNAKTITNLI